MTKKKITGKRTAKPKSSKTVKKVKNVKKTVIAKKTSPALQANSFSKPEIAITEPTIKAKAPVNLQAARKFWLCFLGIGVAVLMLIQGYGYFTGWGDPQKLIERHFNQAQRLTLAKRYQAAISQFEKVVKMKEVSDETKRQAMVGIADLYRERKDWKQAINMYQQLQVGESHNVMAAWSGLKIGECQVAAGEAEQALAIYRQISDKFPNSDWDAEARLGQGQAYESIKQYDKAIEIYQKLEKDYHGGFLAADALIQIGRCYERQGNNLQARKTYNHVIKTYPDTMADEAKRRLKRMSSGKRPQGIRVWGD